jgi:hypothetical protein
MASYVKFYQFTDDLCSGVHNFATGAIKFYLSNATPDQSLDAIKTDLAEITNQNGYTAPVTITVSSVTQSTGTCSVAVSDPAVVTASGGTVGPFRYVVIYNDTPTSPADPLICYYDYGSSITLQDGETFTLDMGANLFTLV